MSRRAGQKQPRVWRHWWSALFVCLAAAAAGLAGCARGRGETARRVVLHVADWGGASADPSMNRFQNEVMAEWQRLHPNIEIQPEHIPGSGEYVPKLLTAFVAGTEPEVMSLDASSAADFIDNDTLRDLTPFVRQDHLDLSTYYPNVLNLARRGEHLYALPADFTPMMLYYNKRLFDKAGVPYPKDGWTWEDFRQACRRLTVWPKGAPHPTRYDLLPLCAREGVPVIAAGVYNSGILADPERQPRFDYAPAPQELRRRAGRLAAVCARHGLPLAAAAIQFPLRQPAVVSVLSGGRSVAELEENVRLFEQPLPAELWAELDATAEAV